MRVLELERYSKVWDSNTNPCIVQGSSLFFVVQSVDNCVHTYVCSNARLCSIFISMYVYTIRTYMCVYTASYGVSSYGGGREAMDVDVLIREVQDNTQHLSTNGKECFEVPHTVLYYVL